MHGVWRLCSELSDRSDNGQGRRRLCLCCGECSPRTYIVRLLLCQMLNAHPSYRGMGECETALSGVRYRISDTKGQAEEQRNTQRAGAPTATFRIVDTNIDMDVILRYKAQSRNDV